MLEGEWDRGDLMLKPWLILIEIIFKVAFQIFFFWLVFTLAEMAIFGRN